MAFELLAGLYPTSIPSKGVDVSTKHRKVVLSFREGGKETLTPQVRGGKGAGLAEMVALGLPVPPGFTVTTTVARAFREHGQLPQRLQHQLQWGIEQLERDTGRRFGDPDNPLLVSVRSGAPVSMPGMMDSVLNVGITAEVKKALASRYGEQFAHDTWQRFRRQYCRIVLALPTPDDDWPTTEVVDHLPEDPVEQLVLAIRAVIDSWESPRAVAYRQAQNIPDWWGTAVTVQAMVFGNLSQASGTGVVFSCNPATGQGGMYGEFLPNAQGEDIVSGTRTPLSLAVMSDWNPGVYAELESYVTRLTNRFGAMVDVEFTVEDGRLYILQSRCALCSPLAAMTFAVRQVWSKRWSHEQALSSVPADEAERSLRPEFSSEVLVQAADRQLAEGLGASPGGAVGQVAFTSQAAERLAQAGQKVVLVRRDTSPDDLPGMLASVAIVTAVGGVTCHAAVVARGVGRPAVVGVGRLEALHEGDLVSVDGSSGRIFRGELPLMAPELPKEANIFRRWLKGTRGGLVFHWSDTRQSANQLLNDVYLADMMAKASAGSRLANAAGKLSRTTYQRAAESLALYLAIAVAGEARYYSETYATSGADVVAAELTRDFGLRNGIREDAWDYALRVLQAKNHADHVRFARLMVDLFQKGRWSGSVGGRRWAEIAKALLDYLQGTSNAVVFVDHVWDLRHNGGRLFDKHPMFSALTIDNLLPRQLDTKKDAADPRQLHDKLLLFRGMRDWSQGQRSENPSPFSAEVEQLYNQGRTSGLW